MDSIKFNIDNFKNSNGFSTYQIDVVINDEVIRDNLLNLPQIIAIANVGGVPFQSSFDLLTCECGVPGCAGFHDQIKQKVTLEEVVWEFPSENYYNTKKLSYHFDKMHFMQEFKKLSNEVFSLEEKSFYHPSQLSDDMFISPEDQSSDEQVTILSLSKSVEIYKSYYLSYKKFNDVINYHFAEFAGQKFLFEYEGIILDKKIDYSFEELICKILNEFPDSRGVSQSYLKRVVLAGVAIKEVMISGEHGRFNRVIERSWKKNGLTPYDILHFPTDDINEDNFDLNKLKFVKI